MSSEKWRPFCMGLNMSNQNTIFYVDTLANTCLSDDSSPKITEKTTWFIIPRVGLLDMIRPTNGMYIISISMFRYTYRNKELNMYILYTQSVYRLQYFCDITWASLYFPITVTSHNLHGVSNHRPFVCLFSGLLRLTRKKNFKDALLALCEGNPPVTGGFPSERASNAESIFISWRHHVND